MEKDFGKIGMPYRTPEEFFEKSRESILEMTVGTMEQTGGKSGGAASRSILRRIFLPVAAAACAAAIAFGVVAIRSGESGESEDYLERYDSYLGTLSDSALAEYTEYMENDIFIYQ